MKEFGLIVIVVLILVCGGCLLSTTTVSTGHRGVLTTWGNPSPGVIHEGIVWHWPFAQRITEIEVRSSNFEVDSEAASKDLQTVKTHVSVNFHVLPDEADKLFVEIGPEYKERIIRPAVLETFKAVTAHYTAEELVTLREKVRLEIQQHLESQLSTRHLIFENVNIVNFAFSDQFNHAIEQKQVAEQESLKAKYELAKKRVEAEQVIVAAEAAARSTMLKAQAESDALALINKSASQKSLLLRAIERWDGVTPKFVSAGEVSTLLNLEEKK